ncbi:MAG: MMPL family transporter [Smithellaceae bacterium]|nr:MMPL family transporter [Smithellaceae bacterium]
MPPRRYPIRWSMVLVTALIVGILFYWETSHLKIETDILESMPHHDPVLASARRVITHLPVSDRVFIDLEQSSADRDQLVEAAKLVEDRLSKSGLFERVGIADEAGAFPELMAHVREHLPSLLSAEDLERKIAPLLAPEKIRETMAENRRSLEELQGIGRAEMIARDPLGFSSVILERMSALLPAGSTQFYSGRLLSSDGRHALVIARLAGSGTDTARAAQIAALVEDCGRMLKARGDSNERYTLTPVGSYRAALDNETVAKRDTRLAILLTMLGISLLLMVAFPRPLIGLLALLPSAVGAISALFVCSLLFSSISVLAVGFGGAILAFTVDLGLTYLLFLDQPRATSGREAAREVWSAEFTAALTTICAFLLLLVSDFKILAQIGVFAALGIAFAFLFVHFVFPMIFPAMPPARREANQWLARAVQKMAAPASWKLMAALVFGLTMLFFAKPVFNVDLQSMNSVSPATLAAEKKLQDTWGNLSGRLYVLLEAPDVERLQKKNDQLEALMVKEVESGRLAPAFLPTVLFPTPETAARHFTAWRSFWTPERVGALRMNLGEAAVKNGFAPDAFDSFWPVFQTDRPGVFSIPQRHFEMLGIARTSEGYVQLTPMAAGKNYSAPEFFARLAGAGELDLFDADWFNRRLGEFLKNMFVEIALIVSLGLIMVVFLFFLDWRLSLAVLAPVAFALVSTLGTLKLIGRPLDIPGIMLWVVILGMGVDYAIYYTCTYQRHPEEASPAMNTVKLSIFLAAATTFIGFGVLTLANHSLLRSIGLVSLLGIGYSLLGAYFILPTLMRKIFAPVDFPAGTVQPASREHVRRVCLRYRLLPGYPRVFARFKMKLDPMFSELDRYVQNPRRILDIGCGFGVPAVWLLEIFPRAQVFGLEPDGERVLIANRVIGARGRVQVGRAPDLPDVEGPVDHVLMLDMLHLIDDREVQLVFQRIYDKLGPDGALVIRATVPSAGKVPWKRWIEAARLKWTGMPERFRGEREITGFMEAAGFAAMVHASPVPGVEEKWFIGKKRGEASG